MLHAFIAALAVEALLRFWRVRAPDDRLALRLLGLGQPLVVTPLLFVVPQRAGEEFLDRVALFSCRRWDDLALWGISPFDAGVVLFALLGTVLFAMDVLPLLRGRRRALPPPAPAPAPVLAALDEVAGALRVKRPALHFVDARGPALFCAGVRRPRLVVSRGALDLLDPDELRGALAHELAHLSHRDPAVSWMVMGARACLFFNPVAQIVARGLARDAEWRADERAGGDRLALASAILKLHRAGMARRAPAPARRTLPFAAALAEPLRRARSHDVEGRCRRLLEPAPPARMPLRAARVVLTTACLALLTFFVA